MAKSGATPLPIESGRVVLPCGVDDFRDFISGLLGKPQTIERWIPGPYEVERDDVTDLYGLILQRVLSQNSGALMQFTATIYYHDNSSVRVDSYEDFCSYNEIRPLVSVALNLNWVFLLQFQNKNAPEKQTINIDFSSINIEEGRHYLRHRRIDTDIRYTIDHTDRTWGSDVDHLLAGALARLSVNSGKIRTFINKNSEKIGITAFAAVMLVAGYVLVDTASKIANSISQRADSVLSSYDAVSGTRLTLQLLTEGAWAKFALYGSLFFVLALAFSIAVGMTVNDLAERRRPSFVSLTKQSVAVRDSFKAGLRANWVKLAATGLVTGAASAIAKVVLMRLLGI